MRAYLTPRMLGTHLLLLLCLLAAGGLGVWQYDAWQTRRAAEASDLTQRDPVPLGDVIGPDDGFPRDRVGQPVAVEGTWLPAGTVYISGRDHDGVDGYWVVTPLTNGGPHDPALPVVRGWTATPAQAPEAPTGTAALVGWLQAPDGTGELDDDPGDDVFPQLRVADLVQRVNTDLYGAYAVLRPNDGAAVNDGARGLAAADLEELPAAGRFTALRNLLYAIEWWFFGAFAAFIWWRSVSEEKAERAVVAEHEPSRVEP